MEMQEQEFAEIINAFRAILADYEHTGLVNRGVYAKAVIAIANAERLMPAIKAGANLQDWWKHMGNED